MWQQGLNHPSAQIAMPVCSRPHVHP
jgi:hypothetical protein